MTAKKQAPKRPRKKTKTLTPEEQARSILVKTRTISSGGLYHIEGESVTKYKE